MSDPVIGTRLVGSNWKAPDFPERKGKETRAISNKPAEKVVPGGKGWYITAIVVGVLLMLAGIFGAFGLLQSHFQFLPDNNWFAKIITHLVDTHHVGALWALAAVGVVGIALTAFGAPNVHKIRKAEQEIRVAKTINEFGNNLQVNALDLALEDSETPHRDTSSEVILTGKNSVGDLADGTAQRNPIKKKNAAAMQSLAADLDAKAKSMEAKTSERERKRFEAMLDDNFKEINVDPSNFSLLPKGTYQPGHFREDGDKPERYSVIVRNYRGKLQCTKKVTKEQSDDLIEYLSKRKQYVVFTPITAD